MPPPATDPASLVPALAPPRRSPSPPSRIVRSTYGGNLFTAEDISYLRNYIEWCVDMGLVLSLREICERLAIKVFSWFFPVYLLLLISSFQGSSSHVGRLRCPSLNPRTDICPFRFYSWRRYCNKHKIKLGSYAMAPLEGNGAGEEEDPGQDESEGEEGGAVAGPSTGGIRISSSTAAPPQPRDGRRSPTPPKSLHRSTTGKGIAFTPEDVTFLVRYMTYRK